MEGTGSVIGMTRRSPIRSLLREGGTSLGTLDLSGQKASCAHTGESCFTALHVEKELGHIAEGLEQMTSNFTS